MKLAQIAVVSVVFLLFCLFGVPAFATANNPTPYIDQPLVPTAASVGGGAFTLTINGAGFVSGATVQWNGSARTTTFVSASQLTAQILATDIANPMTVVITVANPSPGGGVSNPAFFLVSNRASSVAYNSSAFSAGLGPGILVFKTASGDFNGDGKQDLVTLNTDSSISVLLGNGDGTFQPAIVTSPIVQGSSLTPKNLVVGDFNGDGKLDVAVLNQFFDDIQGPQLRVTTFLGNGNGTFVPTVGISQASGTNGTVLLAADLNGDGNLDLIVDNAGPFVYGLVVWLGNGNGTFTESITISPANEAIGTSFHAAIGDLNGDGKIDLVLGYEDESANAILAVALNTLNSNPLNPAPLFGPVTTVDTIAPPAGGSVGTLALAVADFDGNGIPDLAYYFQSCTPPSPCTANLQTYSGNGDGTFQSALPSLGAPVSNSNLIVGDFNGDGIPDVAIQNTILLGHGDGTFASNASPLAQPASLAADFNGDGFLDFFGESSQAGLFVELRIPPDFTGFSSPTSQTAIAGTNTAYTVQVNPLYGWMNDVTLSVSGLPAGVTASFQPVVVSAGNGTTLLSVTTSAATTPGTYTLTLTGTSGTDIHSTNITLVINPASADFGGDILPSSQLVSGGQQANYSVQVVPFNGFSGDVALSVSGMPPGSFASFNPAVVSGGSGTSVLTVITPASAPSGLYILSITGTSGGLSHTGKRQLFINTNADFTGSVSTVVGSVLPGQRASYVANVVSLNGFTGTVGLSVSGLPSGASARFTPINVMGGSGSSSLLVTTSSTTPPGAYILTIAGESGSDSKSTTVSLLVNTSAGDFVGYINPNSQSVSVGGTTGFTVGISPLSGFTGNVTISVSGLPPGATASFVSGNVITGGSGSVNVNISTSATPPGTYTLVFTGTSGGLSHAGSVSLTVTP